MAPVADYLYLAIETFVNTLSLNIMLPCLMTLVKTQGLHGNCKVLLLVSALVQILLLLTQAALFIFNMCTENLMPVTNEKEIPFLVTQNCLFTLSSCLSFVIVMERSYAVWKAAEYERSGMNFPILFLLITGSIVEAMAITYAIYWLEMNFETIIIVYVIEACTFLIAIGLRHYARRKFIQIPYSKDSVNAKYQVKEVMDFSVAITPSLLVSSLMHTLSLVPSILWIKGFMSYALCCVFYFGINSLNCILTKGTLIYCHKGLKIRFKLLFVDRLRTPPGARITRDSEKEADEHFERMKKAWGVPSLYGLPPRQGRNRIQPIV